MNINPQIALIILFFMSVLGSFIGMVLHSVFFHNITTYKVYSGNEDKPDNQNKEK